jgi:cytidine deaminase
MAETTMDKLIVKAREVSARSYSPYSGFAVGCAIQTTDNSIFTGTNVENVSYGLTICAERSAVFNAVSALGPNLQIDRVVIYTPTKQPVTPCGACRQVLREFGDQFEILSICNSKQKLKFKIDDLLPKSPDIELNQGE